MPALTKESVATCGAADLMEWSVCENTVGSRRASLMWPWRRRRPSRGDSKAKSLGLLGGLKGKLAGYKIVELGNFVETGQKATLSKSFWVWLGFNQE